METALFKALSDPTRLRCVLLLAAHEELCVCELTEALGLPQPKVSHHLGNLRKAGIVTTRREGLWQFYRINPDLPAWAEEVITASAQGLSGQLPFREDAAALDKTDSSNCCAVQT